MIWNKSNNPPDSSREVVVVTNYDDVFILKFDHILGEWETPARFNKGEKVAWWTEKPNNDNWNFKN